MTVQDFVERIRREVIARLQVENSRKENPLRLYDFTSPFSSGFSVFSRMTEEPVNTIFSPGSVS